MRQKRQTAVFKLTKFFFSLGLIGFLIDRIGSQQIASVFSEIRPVFLLPALALMFFNTCISTLKWDLFLRADGIIIPYTRLLGSYLIAGFFSLFLPSNIGGDAVRIADVGKWTGNIPKSATSVFADRLSGFFVLANLAFIGSIAGYPSHGRNDVILASGCVLAIVIAASTIIISRRVRNRLLNMGAVMKPGRLRDILEKLSDSVDAYRQRKRTVIVALLISFCFQIAVIVVVYCYSLMLNIECPFPYFVTFVPLISIIEALPISFYGIGTRDAAYVFFFHTAGVSPGEAISLSLVYFVITVLCTTAGGVIFVLRKAPHKTA